LTKTNMARWKISHGSKKKDFWPENILHVTVIVITV